MISIIVINILCIKLCFVTFMTFCIKRHSKFFHYLLFSLINAFALLHDNKFNLTTEE
jgi:histone deacetylase complex regulatory component SIN3